jgi:hypothetical protein
MCGESAFQFKGAIYMSLNCPQCGGEQTKKLTLVMEEGGMAEKGARFGAAYVYNVWIPVATVLVAIAFGIVFAMVNGYLGFVIFVGTFFAGYRARKWMKAKTRSKFADLPPQMKQNGFQCNRCEHVFLPAA